MILENKPINKPINEDTVCRLCTSNQVLVNPISNCSHQGWTRKTKQTFYCCTHTNFVINVSFFTPTLFFSHQLTLWRSTLNKNAKWIKSHPSLTIWTKQRWTILTRDWHVQLQKLKTFNWNRSRIKTPEALPEISFVTLQIGPKV